MDGKRKKNEQKTIFNSFIQYIWQVCHCFYQVILNILYNNNPIVEYDLDIDEILVSIDLLLHWYSLKEKKTFSFQKTFNPKNLQVALLNFGM